MDYTTPTTEAILSDGSGSAELPDEPSDLDAQVPLNTSQALATGGRQQRTTGETTERSYVCLGCGEALDRFRRACPDCEGCSFATVPAGEQQGSATPVDDLLARYARLTAPYNPYIPR